MTVDRLDSSDESENHEKQQEPTQKDPPLKGFGEESIDLELMRLHNLCGPPRFLFTINEETSLDMESEGRKGSRTVSLPPQLRKPTAHRHFCRCSPPPPIPHHHLIYLLPLLSLSQSDFFHLPPLSHSVEHGESTKRKREAFYMIL